MVNPFEVAKAQKTSALYSRRLKRIADSPPWIGGAAYICDRVEEMRKKDCSPAGREG